MKRSKFTEEQIAFALRQVEGGTAVEQVCRKRGVNEATFYRWKIMSVQEVWPWKALMMRNASG